MSRSFHTLLFCTRAGVGIYRSTEGFLFVAIYPRKKKPHGEEDEDSDGELVREEEGTDDRREHVGCGVAVFLKKRKIDFPLSFSIKSSP